MAGLEAVQRIGDARVGNPVMHLSASSGTAVVASQLISPMATKGERPRYES